MIDYDELINIIISNWRNLYSKGFAFQKIALERHIIPIIYFHIRKHILHEKVVASERSFSLKFNQLSKIVFHLYWIILWTIKWLLFFRFTHGQIIVAAVGSDRKLSFAYLKNLLDYANEKQFRLVSLNVICNKNFLLRKKVFYYPRYLVGYKFKQAIMDFSHDWVHLLDGLAELITKNISVMVDLMPVKRFVKDYSQDYYCVNYFLDKFKNDICCLIQDFDYTSNKNIYCEISKLKKIPTISLNHSILIYNHIYESVYSDFSLVWGEQQKNRIEDLSKHTIKNISVLGHPYIHYKKVHNIGQKKYWIYYLPSFENPAAETIYRSVELTLEYIKCIQQVIEDEKIKIQLVVQSHPNDSLKALEKAGFKINYYPILKILKYTALIFCEDSTIGVEMLKSDIPIIYISDKLKRDSFNFNYWNAVEIVYSKEDLENGIKKAMKDRINFQKRQENFEHFFGTGKNFYVGLRQQLNQITTRNSSVQ